MHRDFPAGATVPCIRITVLCHLETQTLIRGLSFIFAFFGVCAAKYRVLETKIAVIPVNFAGLCFFQSKAKFTPNRTEVRKGH